MTDDVRADARRLLQGITPGRWSVKTNRHRECSGRDWGWIEGPRAHYCWTDDKPGQRADAEFIAAAPALVDRLLAELDQALATLQQVRDIKTHNGAPVTPDNLRCAATHVALSASWIYDVLTGLADIIDDGGDL